MSPQPERKDCPGANLADIVDVFADDELVETLRAVPPDQDATISPTLLGLDVEGRTAPGWEELVGLLGDWRADVLAAPIPPVEPAIAHARPRARGHRGSMRSVVAIAGAFLGLLLGSTVVSAREAEPGDLLFGITSIVWPQEAAIAIARLDFLGDLRSAKSALETGSLLDAQAALARAEQKLGAAGAGDRPSLEAQLADVRTQLANPPVAVEASDDDWRPHVRTSPRSDSAVPILASPAESTALPDQAADGGDVASPSELAAAPEGSDPASTAVDGSTTDSAAPSPTATDVATESGTATESPVPSSTPASEDTASPSTGGASSTAPASSAAGATGTASSAPQTVNSTTAATPVAPTG